MLVATFAVKSIFNTQKQLNKKMEGIDAIELRLDYLRKSLNKTELSALRKACSLPVIMTLRSVNQGGRYPYSEKKRLEDILELCSLNPDYLDLEYHVPVHVIQKIRNDYPKIKIILSYHNFDDTPENLYGFFQDIYQPDCYAYKIATYARSTLDALKMLQFVKNAGYKQRIIGLCMGELGSSTRVLGAIMGNFLTYAPWDESQTTAPGQLSLLDFTTLYRYKALNADTRIYALLGEPITASVGHMLHNSALGLLNINAVYVKLSVSKAELPSVISILKELPFFGLSITMPLKEAIVPCLEVIEDEAKGIGAVNTLTYHDENFIGSNTDGMGAARALLTYKPMLSNQTVLLLGAGGAASAIGYTLLQLGAKIIFVNRTLSRAQILADRLSCHVSTWDKLSTLSYDICINTLPDHAYQDYDISQLSNAQNLASRIIAMDIVYQPIETRFLEFAKSVGWKCIPGYEMYVFQALLQIKSWFEMSQNQLNQLQDHMFKFFGGHGA